MENYDYSYLHVVKPHLNFTDSERIPEKHYPFARQKFEDMIKLGILEKEEKPAFYIYQVSDLKNAFVYTGIVGAAAVDDYLTGKIKVHEHTLSKKEEALVKHVEFVQAVGEPVLLTFRGGSWYDQLVVRIEKQPPLFSFVGDEGVKTEVWPVLEKADIEVIEKELASLDAFYIADGHHRTAGSVRYCLKKRKEMGSYTGDEPFNYFLAYFIPTDKLRIFEFNRLVKDLNGMTREEFLEKLGQNFLISRIGAAKLQVKKKHFRFGMYLDHTWFGLDLKPGLNPKDDVLNSLDVSVIENFILKPLLGIHDSKSDERLSFVDGTKGISRLQELVDIGEYRVAFSLFPTRVEEVIQVADQGLTMPPKSTWIEPKLRTGLLIYEV